jgi:hypothetical protein
MSVHPTAHLSDLCVEIQEVRVPFQSQSFSLAIEIRVYHLQSQTGSRTSFVEAGVQPVNVAGGNSLGFIRVVFARSKEEVGNEGAEVACLSNVVWVLEIVRESGFEVGKLEGVALLAEFAGPLGDFVDLRRDFEEGLI